MYYHIMYDTVKNSHFLIWRIFLGCDGHFSRVLHPIADLFFVKGCKFMNFYSVSFW